MRTIRLLLRQRRLRPFFREEAAFTYLKGVIWADGVECPRCGAVNRVVKGKASLAKRISDGFSSLRALQMQFTVKQVFCSSVWAYRSLICCKLCSR